MIRLFFLLGTVLYFSGCTLINSQLEQNSDVSISKRVYKNVSKDAILEATKKMFLIANRTTNNREFTIDSYRDKVEINRVVLGNQFLKADMYLDKWLVEVFQFETESRINLSIIRTDAPEQIKSFEVPVDAYEQFWTQLNFLLGVDNHWMDCETKKYSGEIFDTDLCKDYYYNNKLFTVKPKNDDRVKDIYISQREKKSYTIDKIKTNIFDNPTIESIPDNDEIYTNSEILDDVKIKRTLMEDKIFETKEEKVEITQEEVAMEENNEPTKPNSEEKIKEEDINAFTKNINNIVNKKE